jgi:hypothetical protein
MALADLLTQEGRAEEALPLAVAASEAMERTLGNAHWYTEMARSVRGATLGVLSLDAEAEAMLQQSYQSLASNEGAVAVAVEQALMRLIRYHQKSNNTARADEYLTIYERDFGE